MNVSDVMTRAPIAVSPDQTLIHARDVMLYTDARHLPVTRDAELLGVISARDISAHQARTGESLASSPNDTVSMAMNSPAVTIAPTDSLSLNLSRG